MTGILKLSKFDLESLRIYFFKSFSLVFLLAITRIPTACPVIPLVTENAVKTYVDGQITSGVSTADAYLRKQFVKRNTTLIGTSTASFSAVTASAPAGISATAEDDFLFFLNGQYMEHDALTIQQANGAFYLKVDTDSIGYVLENDDEIIAWGKFNA